MKLLILAVSLLSVCYGQTFYYTESTRHNAMLFRIDTSGNVEYFRANIETLAVNYQRALAIARNLRKENAYLKIQLNDDVIVKGIPLSLKPFVHDTLWLTRYGVNVLIEGQKKRKKK